MHNTKNTYPLLIIPLIIPVSTLVVLLELDVGGGGLMKSVIHTLAHITPLDIIHNFSGHVLTPVPSTTHLLNCLVTPEVSSCI